MNTGLARRSICIAAIIACGHVSAALIDTQDLLRTAQRLQGLEGDVTVLHDLATRHRDEIRLVRELLQEAHNQRYASLALTVLLAMLTGGAAAFLWHRSRRARVPQAATSWYGSIDPTAFGDLSIVDEESDLAVQPGRPPPAVAPVAPVQAPGRFVAPAMPPVVAPALLMPIEVALPAAAPAATFATADPSLRKQDLNVDALHSAQQQAEFFGSLGQFDEALAVLTGYLDESGEMPVLAFLELFRICHATGQRSEYEHLRSRFRETFGMDMTGFGDYTEDQRELDLYPTAVTRIARDWPSETSQQVIDELLFRKPATRRELLSLHAYRDLLWLYGLGQEIVCSAGASASLQLPGRGGLPSDRFNAPWAAHAQQDPFELSLDRLRDIDVASGLDAFAVDVDLTAVHSLAARAAEPAPPTESASLAPPEEANAFDQVMDSLSRKR